MAINTPVDPMAELETLINSKDEKSGNFAPFFFSIQDGQKALIRPLLNLSQYVRVDKHEIWNPAIKKFDVAAVCAASMFVGECAYCVDASRKASNKDEAKYLAKLAASPRIVIPVYVHAVLDTQSGETITYTDKEKNEQPVKGVRLLEMKKSSSILKDLIASYNWQGDADHPKPANHDITTLDYVIKRKGAQLETIYDTSPSLKAPRQLPDDIPAWTQNRDQVLLQYADACPFKLVGDDTPQAAPAVSSPSKGKSVIDDDF